MGKIIYSSNIGFPMRDWENENIYRVAAGTDCIMAITEDGRVLQKTSDPNVGTRKFLQRTPDPSVVTRTWYWTGIQDLAVSTVFPGVAIGLVKDGTCMIFERPPRIFCNNSYFTRINDTIKSWHGIVEVAVSDAFFGLGSDGRVRYVSIRPENTYDYEEVVSWENIQHIVTGMQNIVFGITKDGRVLAAGSNKSHTLSFVQGLENILDLAVGGSEACACLALSQDGKLYSSRSDEVNPGPYTSICSHFWYAYALQKSSGQLEFKGESQEEFSRFQTRVSSFCFGDHDYGAPFFLAVKED